MTSVEDSGVAAFNIESDRTDSDGLLPGTLFGHDILDEVNGHDASFPPLTSILRGPESMPPDDESGTDTDEDGELIKAKAQVVRQEQEQEPEPEKKPLAKKRPPGKGRIGGIINLRDLIEANILTAGEDVLSVEYKGNVTYATLSQEGHILCNLQGKQQRFESPSAFSIALKRLVNPMRKADDGWKTVKYNGRFLDVYKLELAQRRLAELDGSQIDTNQPLTKRSKLTSHSDLASRAREITRTDSTAQSGDVTMGSNLEDAAKMTPCESYRGEPCTTSGSQPYRVSVSPGAELLMDVHAHLSKNEVAGLLAGSWDAAERLLRIDRAFPVQEVQSKESMPSVQMVEADVKAVRQKISKSHGLSCIGWYHSHPHSGSHPSQIDRREHLRQQQQQGAHESSDRPYVGAIVSPYHAALPNSQAVIAYFCVPSPEGIYEAADPAAIQGFALEVSRDASTSSESYLMSMPHHDVRSVAHRCANSSRRTDMAAKWSGITRLEKLRAAVSSRLPETWPPKRVEEYGAKVEAIISAAWSIFGQRATVNHSKPEEEELDISDVSADNKAEPAQWA